MALVESLGAVIDRPGSNRTGTRGDTDVVFSDPFMRAHTRFDSFSTFCERSPWSLRELESVREVNRERLDDYVAATTDFETWEEMDRQAAEEEIIERLVL